MLKSKTWQSFLSRANEAAFWEAWVGAVLARAGLYTMHHPFEADGGSYHALTWDLDVSVDGLNPPIAGGPWVPLEVKGLDLTFNGPDDYPFDGVLVCSARSFYKKWSDADKTLRDFLLVSRKTGAIVWIPVGSPVIPVTVTDNTRDQTYKAMQTKKSYLRPVFDFVERVRGS